MASLVKQHDLYYVQFYDQDRKPQRRRLATRTTDKRTATKKLRRWEDDYALGDFDPWTDDPFNYKDSQKRAEPLTLGEAKDRFIEAKRATKKATTVRTYRHIVGLFARQVGTEVKLANVTAPEITGFIKDPSVAASTHYTRYRHLKAFFGWCFKSCLLKRDRMNDVESPESTRPLPKPIYGPELDVVCEAIRKDYKTKLAKGACREGEMLWLIPLFWFAFYTGMRASELARLRWGHIDEEHGLIYILIQKNKKQQVIPLNRRAAKALATVPKRDPEDYVFASPRSVERDRSAQSFVWYVSSAFRTARTLAKIQRRITFHSLRHGFCTAIALAGKSVAVGQKAARHSSPQMFMRYVDIANEHLRAEIDDVFA